MSRSGDIDGRYLVTERRPKSELTLVPDTSAKAIREPLPTSQRSAARALRLSL